MIYYIKSSLFLLCLEKRHYCSVSIRLIRPFAHYIFSDNIFAQKDLTAAYPGLPFVKSLSSQPHPLSILFFSYTPLTLPLNPKNKPCHLSDVPFVTSAFTLPTSDNKNHHKYQNQADFEQNAPGLAWVSKSQHLYQST